MATVNVIEHQPWVEFIVRKYVKGKRRSEHFEDLVQEGMLALVEAARTFDEARGVKFLTYATPAIHQRVQRFLRRAPTIHAPDVWVADKRGRHDVPLRNERASAALQGNLDGNTDSETVLRKQQYCRPEFQVAPSQEGEVLDNEERALVAAAVQRLPEKQRIVITRTSEGASLTEVAEELGCCKQRAQQLYVEAVGRIRKRLGIPPEPIEAFEAA